VCLLFLAAILAVACAISLSTFSGGFLVTSASPIGNDEKGECPGRWALTLLHLATCGPLRCGDSEERRVPRLRAGKLRDVQPRGGGHAGPDPLHAADAQAPVTHA